LSNKNNSSGGSGIVGLLTILFIGLKLSNIITWTWLWVLSPLWILTLLVVVVYVVIVIVRQLIYYEDNRISKK